MSNDGLIEFRCAEMGFMYHVDFPRFHLMAINLSCGASMVHNFEINLVVDRGKFRGP